MGPLHLAIVLVCAALISADDTTTETGKCPEIKTVTDFKVDKYVGLWYEIQTVTGEKHLPGNCVTARYKKLENGTVEVTNSLCVLGNKVSAVGNAKEESKDSLKNGKLSVNFPVTGPARSSYHVLDTDYDTYSIVYSCRDSVADPIEKPSQSLWVLARDTKLNETMKGKVTDKLKELKLDTLKRTDTDTKNCCYDPKIDDDNSAASVGFSMALLLSTVMVRFL